MGKIEVIDNFIVFEGLDGAGTTTQANLLADKYNILNKPVLNTCEPTKGFIGKAIRKVLADVEKVTPGTIAKLFACDRHEHLYEPDNGIISRCKAGDSVISDRYLFSSLAYQSLDYGFDNVMKLNSEFPLPEHLFFLDVPTDICHKRLSSRDSIEIYEDDILQESILNYYNRSFKFYNDSEMNIYILDGTMDKYELGEIIWSKITFNPIDIV